MRRSLSGRLIVFTLLWLLAALGAGGLALSFAFRESAEANLDRRLDSLAIALLAALHVDGGKVALARPIAEPRFDQVYSGWYWQIDDGDAAPLRSRSLWDEALSAPPDASARELPGPRGQELRALSREVTLPGLEQPVTIHVAIDSAELDVETARFNQLLLISLGLLGAGLIAAVLVQVGVGLRPLRRVAGDLAHVRDGSLSRLPVEHYPTELAPLAATMNDVLAHDEALIDRARAHVGNLAHALKTPLAVLQAETEREGAEPAVVREQLATMTRLTQHHLARAAAAGPGAARPARTPLAPVARAIAASLDRIHGDRQLAIDVELADDLAVRSERQDLEEMLGTLADNACKWARRRVRVSAAAAADHVDVLVDDDGPGIEDERAGDAMVRGVRLDPATPGSGLGLAIAADLASLYGGALRLEQSPLGGLRAALQLPRA